MNDSIIKNNVIFILSSMNCLKMLLRYILISNNITFFILEVIFMYNFIDDFMYIITNNILEYILFKRGLPFILNTLLIEFNYSQSRIVFVDSSLELLINICMIRFTSKNRHIKNNHFFPYHLKFNKNNITSGNHTVILTTLCMHTMPIWIVYCSLPLIIYTLFLFLYIPNLLNFPI